MSHLTLETLARLVDETPTELEAAHLDGCGACRAELVAIREQSRALSDLLPIAPPARSWPALARRLREEGLMRATPARSRGAVWLRRAAVVVGLLASGAAGAALQARIGESGPSGTRFADAPSGTAALARYGGNAAPRTIEEAQRRLQAAEAGYVAALIDYSQFMPEQPSGDLSARLAALEGITLTTGAALNQAPADPVINGYHLTALAQREATLRRIAATRSEPWF